ncbi:hypothetical protein J0I05_00070 [Candidatus Saccharibacteria bacterium]|nr:hypothetical protein [Candidatus Saccharibacteria bacterium]
MDDRPFRMPQPSDRRGVNRPEPTHRASEAPTAQPVAQQDTSSSEPVHRSVHPRTSAKAKNQRTLPPYWKLISAIVAVAIIAIVGVFVWLGAQKPTGIDTSKYQVVFLTNGQFYFGKLQVLNDNYLQLTNVYYMQTEAGKSNTSNATSQQPAADTNYKLIKLGSEIHSPEGTMVLANSQVLYYENLQADGKVSQLMKEDTK